MLLECCSAHMPFNYRSGLLQFWKVANCLQKLLCFLWVDIFLNLCIHGPTVVFVLFVYMPVSRLVSQCLSGGFFVCQLTCLSACGSACVCQLVCVHLLASAILSALDSSPFSPCSILAAQAIDEFSSSNFLIKANGGWKHVKQCEENLLWICITNSPPTQPLCPHHTCIYAHKLCLFQ